MVETAETRDLQNEKVIVELREFAENKKAQNLQGLAQAEILKKKTENYERKLSSRLSGTTIDELQTDHSTSPLPALIFKVRYNFHSNRNVTLHCLGEAERKLKLIHDLLQEQNDELRSSAGVKNWIVLPRLALPVPKRGGEPAKTGKESHPSRTWRGGGSRINCEERGGNRGLVSNI